MAPLFRRSCFMQLLSLLIAAICIRTVLALPQQVHSPGLPQTSAGGPNDISAAQEQELKTRMKIASKDPNATPEQRKDALQWYNWLTGDKVGHNSSIVERFLNMMRRRGRHLFASLRGTRKKTRPGQAVGEPTKPLMKSSWAGDIPHELPYPDPAYARKEGHLPLFEVAEGADPVKGQPHHYEFLDERYYDAMTGRYYVYDQETMKRIFKGVSNTYPHKIPYGRRRPFQPGFKPTGGGRQPNDPRGPNIGPFAPEKSKGPGHVATPSKHKPPSSANKAPTHAHR